MTARYRTFLSLFCWSCLPALAQQPSPPRLTLDVVVTDKSGNPVPGLQQQDFTLLDNKLPVKIESFQAVTGAAASNPPVEVILLLDGVNLGFQNLMVERQQVQKFLKLNGGELAQPVTTAFLSDAGLKMSSLTSRDGNVLLDDLAENKPGLRSINNSQGVYGAEDRLRLSLRALDQLIEYESPRPGRKLVVWISPGWPFLSGPRVDLTTKDEQGIFTSIVAFSDALRRARITLYAVDPLGTNDSGGLRTTYYEQFLKGVKSFKQAQLGDEGLEVLAYQSGGRVLHSSNDVAGEIAACVSDASAYYVLSIDSAPGDGPNEYHALQVKIEKPGLKARTRSGYYAHPDQVRTP